MAFHVQPRMRVILHWICNTSCAGYFVFMFVKQVDILSSGFRMTEVLLGVVCLYLTVMMLIRPIAFHERADAVTIIICSFGKLYYLLFDFKGEANQTAVLLGSSLVTVATMLWIVSASWLGKSFSILPAKRELRFGGPYRFVRHPMYCSYILMDIGLLASFPSVWNIVLVLAAAAQYVARIIMEEKLLSSDPEYLVYSRHTKFRLIPMVF